MSEDGAGSGSMRDPSPDAGVLAGLEIETEYETEVDARRELLIDPTPDPAIDPGTGSVAAAPVVPEDGEPAPEPANDATVGGSATAGGAPAAMDPGAPVGPDADADADALIPVASRPDPDHRADPATPTDHASTDGAPSDEPGATGLLRSSSAVAAGTLLSRMTGLLRTLLFAIILGEAGAAEVYNLANTTPNLLYDLLLGGVLSATLVPVLVSNRERDDQEGTDAVLTVSTIVLVAITVMGFLAAPAIMGLYGWLAQAAGSPYTAAEQDLAVTLLRFFVPQVLFYGLTALGSALLNTHRRFVVAAFAPVLNNILFIVVLVIAHFMITGRLTVEQVQQNTALLLLLGAGTTAGIAAMAVVLWPAIRRAGIPVHWRPQFRNPSVARIVRLAGWTFGYVIVNQIALFVLIGLVSGSSDPQGVSAWTVAYPFFQLPYGVATVSIMTTFTPELASLFARGRQRAFNERFLQGLRLLTAVLLPATVLFVVLARPMVSAFFEHGDQFTAGDTTVTAGTVAGLAWGTVGFSLYLYVLRAFYSMKDTRTPFLINLGENALCLVFGFVLIRAEGVDGLAWAWSLAYTISGVVAFVVLRRRIGPFGLRMAVATTAPVARMVVAGAAMAIVVVLVARVLPQQGWAALLTLTVATALGGAVYGGTLLAFKVDEARDVVRIVARR